MNNIQQAENTASIQPFNNEGAGNPGDSPERNLPSELRHRPKIPRTPNRADRPQAQQQNDQNSNSMNNNSINLP